MCTEISHICQYCKREYFCSLDDFLCPTLNCDRDELMCDSCRVLLEQKIVEDDIDIAKKTLEEILEDD